MEEGYAGIENSFYGMLTWLFDITLQEHEIMRDIQLYGPIQGKTSIHWYWDTC